MTNLNEIAGCVLLRNNEILLVKEKEQDYWKISSGRIEKNELAYNAAIRETKEETGLIVKLKEVLGVFDYNFKNRDFRLFIYLGNIVNGGLSPRDDENETINEVAWKSVEYLKNSIPSNRIIYDALMKKNFLK